MEEKDDIFRFEDFLGGNKIDDLKKMKSNLLKEGLFNENEESEEDENNKRKRRKRRTTIQVRKEEDGQKFYDSYLLL